MIDRRVAVLLVIDGLLLAAIGASSLGDDAPAPIPFGLPALTAVEGMSLARTGQPPVELRRLDGRWTVAGEPIDPHALDALQTAFARPIGADLALDVEGAALDDYGLGEHALTVRFTGDGPDGPLRVGRVVDGRRCSGATVAW